jgi:hypothetical protein
MSNPFEESSNQNPWSNNSQDPRYGNAYDTNDTQMPIPSPALPPRKPTSPYGTQRMPSPSDYHNQTPVVNAWQESNKVLDESDRNAWSPSPQPPTNAYQYTGTAYGNSPSISNAYSPQPTNLEANNTTNTTSHKIETPMSVVDDTPTKNTKASKIRIILRLILFIAAVGHLGFAAGASPVSHICIYVLNARLANSFSIVFW